MVQGRNRPHRPVAPHQWGIRERLSNRAALAILSSDALSSVAYATEELLLVLVLAGSAGLGWSPRLSIAIVGLLILPVISYRQLIRAYPEGGGPRRWRRRTWATAWA